MSNLGTITRRTFLFGSMAITGGVGFGYYKYKQPIDNPLGNDLADGGRALTPYLLIDQHGISIITPRAEMGQGVQTTLAALVAEELDVTLAQVTVLHGPASSAYFNAVVFEEGIPFSSIDTSAMTNRMRNFVHVPAKLLGLQITGGSSSIADAYEKMRVAGAAARNILVKAAAQKLGVAESSLKTENGMVIDANGQALSYLELASAAAHIVANSALTLKPKSEWKILGKSQNRIDVPAKSTGTAIYGIDVELPNMLYASIRVNPNFGAAMNSFDASRAKGMQGVKKIVAIGNGAAVIASNTWYAFKAVNAIEFDWAAADYPRDTAAHLKAVEDSFTDKQQDSQYRKDGDVESALAEAEEVVSAEYKVPYLPHAPLEPMNATAWLRDGKLDIWAGTQIPTQAVKEAIKITALAESNIKIHTTLMGGSFGRRLEMDYIIQAIKVAVEMPGIPVKLTWTREEDMTHDNYRPIGMARFKAVVGDKGPIAIDLQLACGSVNTSQMGRIDMLMPGPDISIVQAGWDQPYAVENFRVTGYRTKNDFPISSWRSVGASQNGFFHESMMDEIAHSKGLDPMQMRIGLITHEPSLKVLKAVAEMSGWGTALPEGHARGVAFSLSFGVPTAEVIEVAIINGKVKIVKAFAAVDVGTIMDPRNVESQVMGGLNFGLAAAMSGDISIKNGVVQETNFHQYRSMRFYQAPEIEVRILENGDRVRGIGEPSTPPAAPALANAIFAATRMRIRELPLSKHIDFV
ncbi:MAG: isoquinoline 1-oxidoreductase beta subunit [Arenicella sp.]|jgi:isoquinoline 1-oxidoreductase beta subunit